MKTKILYSITALLILTFAFVVYASVSTSTPTIHASDDKCCAMKDCCKDGKCSMNNGGKCNCAEMHKKDGASAKHECNSDCCKDGKCTMSADGKCGCNDSNCTMHKNAQNAEHKCGADCCKDGKCSMNSDCCKDGVCKMGCCKDGKCEMHKKDGDHQSMKGGCCGDSCPMHKGEKKDKTDN